MALYDRDYIQNQAAQGYTQSSEQSATRLSTFIKQTYQLFAASLLAASAGAYVGMSMAPAIASWFWPLVILEFVCLFGLYAAKKKAGLNLVLLFAFTFLSGLTLTPLLSVILGMPGGAGIVTNAFVLTTVAFGGLSVFAMNTSRDFSGMGKMLFIALIVMVVAGLINIFLEVLFFNSPLQAWVLFYLVHSFYMTHKISSKVLMKPQLKGLLLFI